MTMPKTAQDPGYSDPTVVAIINELKDRPGVFVKKALYGRLWFEVSEDTLRIVIKYFVDKRD